MKKAVFGLTGLVALGTGFALATAVPTPEALPYLSYTKAAFDQAADKQRVLFFAASWCPNCRAADKDINAKLKTIPGAVVIFKTDYDTELALKTQYNITHQHTFVYVDKAGKALKTWAGGGTAEILANIKSVTK